MEMSARKLEEIYHIPNHSGLFMMVVGPWHKKYVDLVKIELVRGE